MTSILILFSALNFGFGLASLVLLLRSQYREEYLTYYYAFVIFILLGGMFMILSTIPL